MSAVQGHMSEVSLQPASSPQQAEDNDEEEEDADDDEDDDDWEWRTTGGNLTKHYNRMGLNSQVRTEQNQCQVPTH